jgi:hypothetical protein
MKPTVHLHARTFTLLGLATLALILSSAAPACSSNNQAPPSTSTNSTTATGGGTTTTSTTSTTSSTTTTTTGTGGTGGGSADGGPDSGDAGPPCVSDGGTTGCFSCPPQTNAQFLTQCAPSGDQCTSFDNAARLPFWDGGALPPAPQ